MRFAVVVYFEVDALLCSAPIGNIPWSQAAWSLSHDLDETLCGIV